MSKILKFVDEISSIEKSDFDILTKHLGSPFINYDFLSALEQSHCVSKITGWQPKHLASFSNEKLNGFMPLYLKDNSQGEFVFDHSWSYALNRTGRNYYPKLVSAIPFTPCETEKIIGEKINSLFSNIATLNIFELFTLKDDYEKLGYSSDEIKIHLLKLLSTPFLYGVLTVLASIIMFNLKKDKSLFFHVIMGILMSVIIYYMNFMFSSLGNNGKIPLVTSIFLPILFISIFSIIGLIRVNEK